jgi:hypothetical protein
MKNMSLAFRHTARLLTLLLLVSQFALANVDPKKGRVTNNPTSGNRYTIEQEIQLGRQGVAEVEKQLKLLPLDHPMSKYINKLGQSLAAKAPGYKFPYTFKVVREKSINAFAMPGGPIYVHTGLIQAASESELAAVMGHEISHVVMRHSTRQASRAIKAQIPLAILGGVLGAGVGGWAGALGQMGISFTAGSVMMKYSRDAETESDMVGAQIMYDAGYNPEAAVSFFTKLKQQSAGSSGPQFLASHPDPGNRARDITKILSRFPVKTYKPMDSSEYLAAKNSLSDLGPETVTTQKPRDMPRLPVQNIASQNLKTFQHSAFTIDYPANWQVGGNTSEGVSISPKGGSENGTIAYGVMISGFEPKTRSNELDDALRELTTDIQMTNPGMTLANSPQAVTLNGRSARKLDWIGSSPVPENGKPMRERVRLVAFQGKSRVILYLIFVAPDADFQALWPTFERMLNSMRVR